MRVGNGDDVAKVTGQFAHAGLGSFCAGELLKLVQGDQRI